jgi:hypothetical protein
MNFVARAGSHIKLILHRRNIESVVREDRIRKHDNPVPTAGALHEIAAFIAFHGCTIRRVKLYRVATIATLA